MKETKYFYRADKSKHIDVDTRGISKYYGAFYAKLTNTINRIKQFNEMVYEDPAGADVKEPVLQGKAKPELIAKIERKRQFLLD
jgi:hypothetical protein